MLQFVLFDIVHITAVGACMGKHTAATSSSASSQLFENIYQIRTSVKCTARCSSAQSTSVRGESMYGRKT